MEGIKNFLFAVNDNWTTIVVICGLGIGVYRKIRSYLRLSNDQKIQLAFDAVDSVILSMVSDAESNYAKWKGAGALKRSEVINRIFSEFPILSKMTDTDKLTRYIDNRIDEALIEVKAVLDENFELYVDNENND